MEDLGEECYTVTDNLPCAWKIFLSKTNQNIRYLVIDKEKVLTFQNIEALEKYVDEAEDAEDEAEEYELNEFQSYSPHY